MKIIEDFKAFAFKGNVLDMAVGVIIGGAFGKIVSSLVADIITPLISLIVGSGSIADRTVVLKEAVGETPAVTLNYGLFIQNIIDFLIIAICIFLFIRIITKIKERGEKIKATLVKKEIEEAIEEAPAAPEPSNEEKLLCEIRDLLKEQNKK